MGSSASSYSRSNDGSENDLDEFYPTETDVYAVRNFFLGQGYLYLELIDIILDLAEYWPRVHAEYSGVTKLQKLDRQWSVTEYCVTTPAIPLRPLLKVRSVKFTMECLHDQGFKNPSGAWSWFQASILRDYDPKQLSRSSLWTAMKWRARLPSFEEATELFHLSAQGADYRSPVMPASKRRCEVVWTPNGETCRMTVMRRTSKQSAEVVIVEDISEELKGRTKNASKKFVELLQRGDQVALLGTAYFPIWSDYVYTASVDIAYSISLYEL